MSSDFILFSLKTPMVGGGDWNFPSRQKEKESKTTQRTGVWVPSHAPHSVVWFPSTVF